LTEDRNSKQKIIIAGYYGNDNAGDEAILQGILTELRALGKELGLVVISRDPSNTEKLHHVKAIAWKDFDSMIEEVKSSSLVIVGGGGLIQDYWGVDETSFLTHRQGGISEYGSPIILANLFGIPSMFYAVGVGPLNTPEGKDHTRMLFQAVDGATVRDENSWELIRDLDISVSEIPIVPDPAMTVSPIDLPSSFTEWLEGSASPVIGVSVRYWGIGIEPRHWLPQVAEALDGILEGMGGSAVFMPMHVSEYYLENDHVVCRQIQERMKKAEQTRIASTELSSLERFAVWSQFDFVFGMRLHAVVATLKAGLPCVAIEYDPKVAAFMEQWNLSEYCFSLYDLEPTTIANQALKAYQEQEMFKAISAKIAEQYSSLSKSARMASDLLGARQVIPQPTSMLVNFAVQQTLNVARSEEEKVHLNEIFRKIWADRLGPNFNFEHAQTDLEWIERQLLVDHERMQRLEAENATLLERTQVAETGLAELKQRMAAVESQLSMEREERVQLEDRFNQVQSERWQLKERLSTIEDSRGFKILEFLWGILWRIRDPKQTFKEIRSFFRTLGSRWGERTKALRTKVYDKVKGVLPARLRHLKFVLDVHHLGFVDNSTVHLYYQDVGLFPGYEPRKKIHDTSKRKVEVTLVTTVRNEADNAQRWLEDLERQRRIPDEIVLLEGGSVDDTYSILEAFAAKTSLNLRVITKPGTNIATRRNLGVSLASYSVIAMTDFGCTLEEDWLEKMMVPFESDPEIEVVAGGYDAQAQSRLGNSAKYELIPSLQDMYPQSFLPACRSIAFRKSAWEKVGGFPEYLTKTGEDTFFDLQLKRKCPHWAFVPEAQVIWHAPETLKGIWDKLSSWTVGDGESGAFAPKYWKLVVRFFRGTMFSILGLAIAVGSFWVHPLLGLVLLMLWILVHALSLFSGEGSRSGWIQGLWGHFGRAARVNGFLEGLRNRPAVMKRKHMDVKGVVLFLTGVPIDDTGGGARGTQIALELLRRGNMVIFVHKYPKQESVDLELEFDHPHLLHFSLEDFDWVALSWELKNLMQEKPLTAILEFPFKEFLSIAKDVKGRGGKVIYDLIDEWNTSLGGDWYSEEVEQRVVERSDILMASAPSLVKRLEDASGREALWMPNAVNLRLFDRERIYAFPEDLLSDSPRILYIGALWGEWFDWELLQKIVHTFSQGSVTVIGDYHGQCTYDEPNLRFLGLKSQTSLPAYLQHSDVAIIPWKIGPITQATSPLKIFEYLAMGTPVVAPKLKPLEGIPYVYLAENHKEFLENITQAQSCVMENHVLDEFLRKNSWQARLDQLAGKIPHFGEPEQIVES
jgi:polysaccharide pyruvyl transferase CsaB